MIDESLFKAQIVSFYTIISPICNRPSKHKRGVGRRERSDTEIGMSRLEKMIPTIYPYVVRVVSDILDHFFLYGNCLSGTLALMDAGVQIKKPVSGIAMGLISENKGTNFAVLSDILGDEDHLGDMDFKVTGTKDGITATQMDIKVDGLSYEILEKALQQAHTVVYTYLKIQETLPAPRPD